MIKINQNKECSYHGSAISSYVTFDKLTKTSVSSSVKMGIRFKD